MNALRAFVRGLSRMITNAIARSMGSRIASAGVRGAGGFLDSSVARAAGGIDGLLDDIGSQIGILDILDLASEAEQIVESARQAAAMASADTFINAMETFNPGQQSLVENYCLDFAQEYWENTDAPNPSEYIDGMYSQHEGIEQALSGMVEMSYEAGRTAGADSLYTDIAVYIGTELVARGLSMHDYAKLDNNWQSLAADIAYEEAALKSQIRNGTVPRHVRWRYNGGHIESMIIDAAPGALGATRQLSWSQFAGIDQPYWFTERQVIQGAWIANQISYSNYQSRVKELYRVTARDPWATSAPAGYEPYHGKTYGEIYS